MVVATGPGVGSNKWVFNVKFFFVKATDNNDPLVVLTQNFFWVSVCGGGGASMVHKTPLVFCWGMQVLPLKSSLEGC